MVEPSQSLGAQIFAICITLMIVSAGLAAMRPANDKRVLIGALILGISWAATLALQDKFDYWGITKRLFVLDYLIAVVFLFLSRPSAGMTLSEATELRWSANAFFCIAVIATVELLRFLLWYSIPGGPFALFGLVLFLALLNVGFYRGFGRVTGAITTSSTIIILGGLIWSYNRTLNLLTGILIAIVAARGLSGAFRNIQSWRKNSVKL